MDKYQRVPSTECDCSQMLMPLIGKSGFILTLNTINKFVFPYDLGK